MQIWDINSDFKISFSFKMKARVFRLFIKTWATYMLSQQKVVPYLNALIAGFSPPDYSIPPAMNQTIKSQDHKKEWLRITTNPDPIFDPVL